MNRALLLLLLLPGCGAEPWVAAASNASACPRSWDEVCLTHDAGTSWCSPGMTCTWQRDQGRQVGAFTCEGTGRCKTYEVR